MRLLRLAPWRRGPALLVRRPGVALALVAAGLVAALPAAAAPLFLSSSQHATLHRQVADTCLWHAGMQFSGSVAPSSPWSLAGEEDPPLGVDRYRQREELLTGAEVDGLGEAVTGGYGDFNVDLADRPLPEPDHRGVRLLARDGFEEHVEVLDGPDGEGVWLPHTHAERQGIQVGDEVAISPRSSPAGYWDPAYLPTEFGTTPGDTIGPDPEPVTVRVAAIFRDLTTIPTTPYWCGVEDFYAGTPTEQADPNTVILPAALVSEQTLLAAGEATRSLVTQVVERELLDPRLNAPEAERITTEVEAAWLGMSREHPLLFRHGFGDETNFVARLDRFVPRAALVRDGLLPPVVPITVAGTLVGLVVAGAAAVFWVQRRRTELAVLAGHGAGAGMLGVKAVLEALPAVLVGAAAGWGAAWALVAAAGPSATITPGARPLAAALAGGVAVVTLGLIGVLAAAGARGLTDSRPVSHGRRWWRRVPWELGLVVAAVPAWLLLTSEVTADESAGGVGSVAHVPPRMLVAPILIIGGLAVFGARLTADALRRRGLARTPRHPARLLAWRRSVRAAAATAVLAAATAIPVAIATYGGTATASIRVTADAQLRFNLGTDTVITHPRAIDEGGSGLAAEPELPAELADRSTFVLQRGQVRMDGLIVDLLAVDPETFADVAFWDNRIPGPSLADAVSRLTTGDTPTVVASRRIPSGPSAIALRDQEIPVEVVDTRPLPGATASFPLVIIHRDVLETMVDEFAQSTFVPQTWIAGDPDEDVAAVRAAEVPVTFVSTIDHQRTGAVYEPVTFTFQYLIALSVFTGLIAAVGLVLHLESRTAAHRRGYVMLRRLGLTPRTHRRALLLEVGVPMLAGLLVGGGGTVALAYGFREGFDLSSRTFPDALLELPVAMMGTIAAATIAIAIAAGLLAHARIRRADPAEVLRDTT